MSTHSNANMWSHLKALALRLMGRGGWPPPPPEDPRIGVREPRRRGPGGKSAAVALEEPDEWTDTHAVSRHRPRA